MVERFLIVKLASLKGGWGKTGGCFTRNGNIVVCVRGGEDR